MAQKTKIFLCGVLLLIAIQLIFQGINQIYSVLKMNLPVTIGVGYWIAIFFGILFFLSAIFVFSKKSWVKNPLFVLLVLFLIYSIFNLLGVVYFYQGGFFETYGGSMGTALFLSIDYLVLTIISIVLLKKNRAD